jgi:hypothetical protein
VYPEIHRNSRKITEMRFGPFSGNSGKSTKKHGNAFQEKEIIQKKEVFFKVYLKLFAPPP